MYIFAHYLITTARCPSRSTYIAHTPRDGLTLSVAVTIFQCLMSFPWTHRATVPSSKQKKFFDWPLLAVLMMRTPSPSTVVGVADSRRPGEPATRRSGSTLQRRADMLVAAAPCCDIFRWLFFVLTHASR